MSGTVTRQIVAGERNLVGGAAFLGRMRARVTDENAPHHDRGERDETGRGCASSLSADRFNRMYASCTSAVGWSVWSGRSRLK
jgi:hypothetical protein